MARTTVSVKCNDAQAAMQRCKALLTSNGYKEINYNGENVWKRGNGFWTAIKYIKIEFSDAATMLVSGWICPMLGGELDLDGFFGALPKKQVLKVIKQIQTVVS